MRIDDDQEPFATVEFADNPEPRLPCVLLLDTSTSMAGAAIAELNAGLRQFIDEVAQDSLAYKRVDLSVVTFGPVKTEMPFGMVPVGLALDLSADGNTPMGAAIVRAASLVEARKREYRANRIAYFRPWIFLITDGEPTDDWARAAEVIAAGEERGRFSFYAVGVEGASMEKLAAISVRKPLRLRGLAFRELFAWLSNSMSSMAHSQPGQLARLPRPDGPDGWTDAQ